MHRDNDDLFEDDLLQPSLTDRHNVIGVLRAFDPRSITWVSFFVGPFGAAFLVWRNNANLKIEDRLWLLPLLGALVMVVPMVFSGEEYAILESGNWGLVTRAATVAATFWATQRQRGRFRIYSVEGGQSKSLWGEGVLAFVMNYPLCFGLLILVGILAS